MFELNEQYYCVLDLEGKVVWEGRRIEGCANNWLPGTYWGKGINVQSAIEQALAKVDRRKWADERARYQSSREHETAN